MNEYKIKDNILYLNGQKFEEVIQSRFLYNVEIDINRSTFVVLNIMHDRFEEPHLPSLCRQLELEDSNLKVYFGGQKKLQKTVFNGIILRTIYDPDQLDFILNTEINNDYNTNNSQ